MQRPFRPVTLDMDSRDLFTVDVNDSVLQEKSYKVHPMYVHFFFFL